MIFYFDDAHLKEFLAVMRNWSKEEQMTKYKELLHYIRLHCVFRTLPLEDNNTNNIRNKHSDDYDPLGKEFIDNTIHRDKKLNILHKNLKDIRQDKTTKEGRHYDFKELLNRWLTEGDVPYSQEYKDDKLKNYAAVCFANDKNYENLTERGLCNLSIEEYLKGYLNQNMFSSSRLIYTGNTKEWSELITCNLPSSEIIIVDPYLFSNKSIKSTENLINHLTKSSADINIIFVCNTPTLKERNIIFPDYGKIYNNLKDKYPKCKFLFVLATPKELHDRYIITNNGLYMSGHSFANYYPKENSTCNAKGGIGFSIHYFLNHDNELVLKDIIENGLNIVVRNSIKGHIFGDKNVSSSLLNIAKEKIITCEQWKKIWTTEIFEGMDVIFQCEKKEEKYLYIIKDCDCIGNGEIDYGNNRKAIIQNIRLNKKGEPTFFAKFIIKE